LPGACLLLALLAGCASRPPGAAGPSAIAASPIDEVHLLSVPAALNLDQLPGADGFAVKIFAGNRKQPKPVSVTSGTLEILMFDGVLKDRNPSTAKPLRIWSFSASQLKDHLEKTSIGASYRFTLLWGEAKPAQENITILARYVSTAGATIYSAPSTISVAVY
jgi:hypothetical protein